MPQPHSGELTSAHIVERTQAELSQQVAEFREQTGITPGLSIISNNYEHAPSRTYIGLKDRIGHAVGMTVSTNFIPGDTVWSRRNMKECIKRTNDNKAIHGMIVQLPLHDPEITDEILEVIDPKKDVDGLGSDEFFAPATPLAIVRLLEGYDIDYRNESVAILGRGRLVGAPLLRLMQKKGAGDVEAYDRDTPKLDLIAGINRARIIVSATGQPGILTPELFDSFDEQRVLVDAGAAEQGGVVIGDISAELRDAAVENGWQITPQKGGVGPLTVRTLLTNVLSAAELQVPITQQVS